MKTIEYRAAGLLVMLSALMIAALAGDKKFDLGVMLGGGYTAVNFEEASGYSDDYLNDWGQVHFKAVAYCLIPLLSRFKAGVEIGYNDLYWWYYRVPYGPSPVYREVYWSTLSFLGIVRKELPGLLYLQAGAGLHSFFDDGTALALSAALGIKPRISRFGIPICLRVDPIFGAGMPITIALCGGLEM